MASGFLVGSTDLDSLLEPRRSAARGGTGFLVGSADISTRYEKYDPNHSLGHAGATGYQSNGTDIGYLFAKKGSWISYPRDYTANVGSSGNTHHYHHHLHSRYRQEAAVQTIRVPAPSILPSKFTVSVSHVPSGAVYRTGNDDTTHSGFTPFYSLITKSGTKGRGPNYVNVQVRYYSRSSEKLVVKVHYTGP